MTNQSDDLLHQQLQSYHVKGADTELIERVISHTLYHPTSTLPPPASLAYRLAIVAATLCLGLWLGAQRYSASSVTLLENIALGSSASVEVIL